MPYVSELRQSTIGKEFTLKELFKFVAPPVFTRLMVSLLSTLDDSLFVSRFLGQNALAAFSIAFPWFMLIDAIGMMASSVSVICSIKMGEKRNEEAKSDFTTTVIMTFVIGLFFTLILCLFLEPILRGLGETEILMPYAKEFFSVSRFYVPFILMNYVLNSFYVIAGKPKWSMYVSAINMIFQFFFDWLFIVKLNIGMKGAAYANLLGSLVVTLIGLFFYSNKNREMCFTKPHRRIFELMRNIFKYGKMQAMTSLAVSLNGYINNQVHLALGGEAVVAAYSIVANVTFMFMNSFFGLIGSTSPIASYAFGEKNPKKLVRICKQTVVLMSILIVFIISVIVFGRKFFIMLYFTDTSSQFVKELAYKGMMIYPLALVFFGYNVYVQDLLNVLGNHKVSMFLSFLSNVFFINIAVLIIPRIFGINAVWYCFIIAEGLTFIFTLYFVYRYKDVYGFNPDGIASFVNR